MPALPKTTTIERIRTTNKVAEIIGQEHKQGMVTVPDIHASVSLTQKFTRSIPGAWSSVGAAVTITMPCGISEQEIEACYEHVHNQVCEYLDREHKHMVGN